MQWSELRASRPAGLVKSASGAAGSQSLIPLGRKRNGRMPAICVRGADSRARGGTVSCPRPAKEWQSSYGVQKYVEAFVRKVSEIRDER